MESAWIGSLGMALLAAGWARQAVHTLQTGKSGLRLKFSGTYALGSALLVYYSMAIGDWLFTALNAIAGIMALIEFAVRARQEKRLRFLIK